MASSAGIHEKPDMTLLFESAAIAVSVLVPPRDWLTLINAGKAFQMWVDGPDELTSWFMETLSLLLSLGTPYGTDAYGDFKFDRLQPQSGIYTVIIALDGFWHSHDELAYSVIVAWSEPGIRGK